MINVVLYGFGGISHALISQLKSKNFHITVLTKSMSNTVITEIKNIKTNCKNIVHIKNEPNKCLKNADYLIFCVPSHLRKSAINKIKNYIQPHTILGALPGVSGFNEEIKELLPYNNYYFSAQRVPFIARVIEKGKLVEAEVKVKTYIAATNNIKQKNIEHLELLFGQKVKLLSTFELVNLTNSNPLLHTARIFEFIRRNNYSYEIRANEMFYEDWTDEASEILVNMDTEFQGIMKAKGLKTPSILQHYKVENIKELTIKISNIQAFRGIKFPMKLIEDRNTIDFSSRYFLEDFGLGLKYTIEKGKNLGVPVNNMVDVYSLYENKIKKLIK